MESASAQGGTGENTSGVQPEWPAGLDSDGLPLPDPRIVEKLVEDLKSQGMFDQIRKDCLAEVDTKVRIKNFIDKLFTKQIKVSNAISRI